MNGQAGAKELDGYADACLCYHPKGWTGILKLERETKYPPPSGFTGQYPDPSIDQIATWGNADPLGNTALRVPDGVVAFDIDGYGDKTGGKTLQVAQSRWGELPETWINSSRHHEDPVSGHRFFRIPQGVKLDGVISFPELGIGDIEIIQHHHRYAVVYPSIHPSGSRYRWKGPRGQVDCGGPRSRSVPRVAAGMA